MDTGMFKRVLLLLALGTGCAGTEQAYEGSEQSDAEVAVITNSYTGTRGLKSDRAEIISVDGNYFDGSTPGRVEVLPGRHSVEIRCWHGGLLFENSVGLQEHQGSVEFVAEAGREYRAFCSTSDGRFVRWITDLEDGAIVGGTDKPSSGKGEANTGD